MGRTENLPICESSLLRLIWAYFGLIVGIFMAFPSSGYDAELLIDGMVEAG